MTVRPRAPRPPERAATTTAATARRQRTSSGAAAPTADGVLEYAIGTSSLGLVLVARSARGITAVLLDDDRGVLRDELARRFPHAMLAESGRAMRALVASVVREIDAPGHGASADLPLDLRGTAFQQRVWRALREIPAGSTATYTEVAARIGSPRSVRAVARACATNHVSILVPCHRVVRRGGALAGYYWGVERKRILLEREQGAVNRESTQRRRSAGDGGGGR